MSSFPLKWARTPLEEKTKTGDAKARVSDPESGGGGYFTLSESEGGSNDEYEIKIDKDFNRSPRKFSRKIFAGLRGRSETPPRPSPPKDYHRDETPPRPSPPKLCKKSQTPERRVITDEPPPPKPPPPLSYTSTLPPPVPKKIISKNYRYRSKTLPARKNMINKDKVVKDSQQAGSAESILPQSSSEEFLHSSTPTHSSDEECFKSDKLNDITGLDKTNVTQGESKTVEFPQKSQNENSKNTIESFNVENLLVNSLEKFPLNNSNNKTDLMFSTPFDKTNDYKCTNSLLEIGSTVDIDPVKNEDTEKRTTNESNATTRNSVQTSIQQTEACNNHSDEQKESKKSSKLEKSSCIGTSETSCNTGISKQLPQGPKCSIASESLAERALHSSQEQLQKLKHYVPREEIAKYRELGLQVFDFKRDSPEKKKERYSISRSRSCSSASSSKSAISMPECQSIKSKKGKGSFSKLFPAKSFSSLIRRNEKSKQKLTKDAKNIAQMRSCQSSPTPSMESSISFTLTENSSLCTSTLAAVSEITSERSVDISTPDYTVQQSNMAELDKYVADMMTAMQEIRTPSQSPDVSSKELVEIISFERKKTACEETKASLQSIIDQIKNLKPVRDHSKSPQSYSLVMYAGSYCCTPPLEEDAPNDLVIKENIPENSFAKITQVDENDVIDPSNIILNNLNIFKLENYTPECTPKVDTNSSICTEKEKVTSLKIKDQQPIPSPRLKRNKKVSSILESTNQQKAGEDKSDTSITSFNNLITDLLVSNTHSGDKSSTSKKQQKNTREKFEKDINEINNKSCIIQNQNQEESNHLNELELLSSTKETMNKKFKILSDQLKVEIGFLKSQYEDHAEQKRMWEEKETTFLEERKTLEYQLKEQCDKVELLNENLKAQNVILADKEKQIVVVQEQIIIANDENLLLSERNIEMKQKLEKEIIELKEIKTNISEIHKDIVTARNCNDEGYINEDIRSSNAKDHPANTCLVEEKLLLTKEILEKDEMISKLKMDLKKRGVLLHDSQTVTKNDSISTLNQKLNEQNNALSKRDETIKSLEEDISTIKTKNLEMSKMYNKMKFELQHEIQQLKEIKDDVISLVNFKQDSDSKEISKQEEILKQQHSSKETGITIEDIQDRKDLVEKIKILEMELVQIQEEKCLLQEENTHISRRLSSLQNKDELITKLKIDLKKRGVLLKDAQAYIDVLQKQNDNKTLRQMKTQIEDLESEKNTMSRQKKHLEYELEEIRGALEDIVKKNQDLEKRFIEASKENNELTDKIFENEEEIQEIMKKYKNSVASITSDQITLQAQSLAIIQYENEITEIKDKNYNLLNRIEELEAIKDTSDKRSKLQLKVSELEHKLELEKTTRNRMEMQITRLRETVEKLDKETEELRLKSQDEQEMQRKLFNQLKDLKEDYTLLQRKETEMSQQKSLIDKKILITESENDILKKELEIAHGRIDDFQIAINSEIGSDTDTAT